MRDRHIFWDIAPLILLSAIAVVLIITMIQNERGWGVMQKIREEQSTIASQNQKLIAMLSEGVQVRGGVTVNHPPQNGEKNPNTNHQQQPEVARRPGMEHIPPHVKLPVVPNTPRGDENADDGDWLVETTPSEPNSLNPMRDNDASVSTFFGLANDALAARNFDDLSIWEPRLAHAWTKELVCLAYVKDGKASELAQQIEQKWPADLKKKLQIKKISADGPDVLRIEIDDVNNDYSELLMKDFGPMLHKQWWFYVSYEGMEFMDGTPITPKAMEAKLQEGLKKSPDFKGTFAPGWAMEDKVILRVLGDEAVRDAVEKTLKEMTASKDNLARVLDEKSATGKREQKNFNYDLVEDYVAQEKPVFTFYLRKDVKWHDGKPFSGKDVLFSYRTMMNPKIECGHIRNYYNDCENVELVDGNEFIVRATWIRPYFEAFTFSAGIDILPEHVFKFNDPAEFNAGKVQTIVGNGAYKLQSWERGSRFVFVRNEEYYGRKPHLKRVIYQIVKDPTAELQMFEKGDTDIYGLRPSQMEQKEKDENFKARFAVDKSTSNSYSYIGWNARLPLFKDKKVRQALTMLVDRERICKDIMRGYARPQHGTVHPENPAYWKDLPNHALPFDASKARTQLAEAGWSDTDNDGVLDKDGQPFKFTLIIRSNNPEHEAIANLVKDSFKKAGIVVNVSNLEWSVLLQQVERLKFDAVLLGWRLGLAEDPYQLWHSSQTGEKASNFCNFVSKEADRIIEKNRRELKDERRYKMLERFQQIVLEEQPYTFLYVPTRLVAYDKRIQNVKYKLVGSDRDRWWVPKDKQKHKD
ncbi:MAG TPA: ABC transporter substrate-binding protein [Planctomycetota bacterium]|nr:ABC transporter substrate-binding protein [Planctomycetota bacterium]